MPLLTKREYFVAAVLQGLLSGTKTHFDFGRPCDRRDVVVIAIEIADNTIAQLEK